MAAAGNHQSLEHTPTWAVATVYFVFISISIALEHFIHLLTNWLKRRRKTALVDAVERLKSELMLLGFMSLLLAVTQSQISSICIPAKMADIMLPCRKQLADQDEARTKFDAASDRCSSQGKVSLVTKKGVQQLHQFIFVLAVMQIVYSVITMTLGRAKMRRWKAWEKETQTTEYQVANDPERFRLTRQTTFGRRHVSSCTETSIQLWIKCFFRQFYNSVAKVDYLTLRHGFISAHLSGRYPNFNFQKYIERSLDEDFKIVVSISPLMWFLVVIFLLVDVHGWHVYLWLSYVPLLIVLILGAKLEVIVAQMALRINNQSTVIRGTPLVQPNDELFWFGRPKFVLTLLHFTLFTNAFELAFFIWVSIQFGFDSCYHEHTPMIITRIVLAITVQVLCSYITLPLYALVTQMGSKFRNKVLSDQMAKLIKQWHTGVRERRKKQELLQSPRTDDIDRKNSVIQH
ncbi:Mlo-related protein [Corchorus olitorius]|uniref:MLO-like protein n=1 Tax=Corchorus olitorius TaxID=93759 RepID=A0A1R3HTL0_9ROSI|nr:Mlo-related protein [Corchorus olitorius]